MGRRAEEGMFPFEAQAQCLGVRLTDDGSVRVSSGGGGWEMGKG